MIGTLQPTCLDELSVAVERGCIDASRCRNFI